MASVHLWKFPKELYPDLKEAYLSGNWLYLIKQFNYYLVGDSKLCPVCPDSVSKIKEYLKPIFLADVEVLFKEGKRAGQNEMVELFLKYVSSDVDPLTVAKIPEHSLNQVVATFANTDLKARQVSQRRRLKILKTVFGTKHGTFNVKHCDEC